MYFNELCIPGSEQLLFQVGMLRELELEHLFHLSVAIELHVSAATSNLITFSMLTCSQSLRASS